MKKGTQKKWSRTPFT